MKIQESKGMTIGEATLKIYKTIESIGYESDSEDFNELKKDILGYIETNSGYEKVKNIFKFVFDNYNELKGLIN